MNCSVTEWERWASTSFFPKARLSLWLWLKRCVANISVNLTGMPKHYQKCGENTGRNVSGTFLRFCLITQWTWPLFSQCDPRPSLPSSCELSQKQASECAWTAMGRKRTLFELGEVQTQTVHGSLCETERRTKDPLALQTLPAVQIDVCICVCVCICVHMCAHVHALVPVHNCSQIQI